MKTYEEITRDEALELLKQNDWQPVEGLALRDELDDAWGHWHLVGVMTGDRRFAANDGGCYPYCARIIEKRPLITEEQRKAARVLRVDANWLALDKDGEAFCYRHMPILADGMDCWEDNGPNERTWRTGLLDDYAPDWKSSLVDLREPITE